MKKFALLLLSLTLLIVASGCSSESTNNDNPDAPASTESNEANTSSNTTTDQTSASDVGGTSMITDEVVQRVCGCLNNAKNDDGTIDFPKMNECMDGKSKVEFVQDLLGPDATEKDRADAERELTERMNEECPR